jgi:putative membrane protein
MRLYEFRLSRLGEDLRTEYGLLTRVTASIPLRRVQTVTVRESPLQRLAKRMSVRVETAGGQATPGQPQLREWLAPIIRRTAVPALVREVLPGVELEALEWQPLRPRAFRRAVKLPLVFAVVMTLPFAAGLGSAGHWAGLAVLPLAAACMAAMTWKYIQHTQWAATEHTLAFRSGWLWRTVVVVPVVKIQVVGRIESPFDRRAAMARLRVDTAGGPVGMHRIAIPYLARETATDLYEKLAVQTAQTALRW